MNTKFAQKYSLKRFVRSNVLPPCIYGPQCENILSHANNKDADMSFLARGYKTEYETYPAYKC